MKIAGEKSREARGIASAMMPFIDHSTTYCEPFCGSCSVAVEVIKASRPRRLILSDKNKNVVQLIKDGDEKQLIAEYDAKELAVVRARRKILEQANISWHSADYKSLNIPTFSVVYLDPPLQDSSFDYDEFWEYVRALAERCIVFVSSYNYPEDFSIHRDFRTRRGKADMPLLMFKGQEKLRNMADAYIEKLLKDEDGSARYDLLPKRALMRVAKFAETTVDDKTRRVKAMQMTSEELTERAKILLFDETPTTNKKAEAVYNLLMSIWHDEKPKK